MTLQCVYRESAQTVANSERAFHRKEDVSQVTWRGRCKQLLQTRMYDVIKVFCNSVEVWSSCALFMLYSSLALTVVDVAAIIGVKHHSATHHSRPPSRIEKTGGDIIGKTLADPRNIIWLFRNRRTHSFSVDRRQRADRQAGRQTDGMTASSPFAAWTVCVSFME